MVSSSMQTKILKVDSRCPQLELIEDAAALLRAGETVVFPTETVYGLGANGLDEKAAAKIYTAKGRPSDNPLILHIADEAQVTALVTEIPVAAQKLIQAFWPGPLTLIFKKRPVVPAIVSGGLATVALRMPSHAVARALIAAADVPVAAPSANLSGRPSPTRPQHVIEDMAGRVAAILTCEEAPIGLESTVVDVSAEVPTLLRPGGISLTELQAVVPELVIDRGVIAKNQVERPKSPGMKYTHYAPRGEMVIVRGSDEEKLKKILAAVETNSDWALLVSAETARNYQAVLDPTHIVVLASRENPVAMARNLFDKLRYFDELGATHIYAEDIDLTPATLALVNRLHKAAGHRFI